MGKALAPRLDKLHELSKKLNSTADDIGQVVQGVETYLNEVCRLGIHASTLVEADTNEEEGFSSRKSLVYGRYGTKYRLFVVDEDEHHGNCVGHTETLWANCPRDLKLAAYLKLPNLLDDLITRVQETLEHLEENTEKLQAILPPERGKKKETTS